VPNIKVDVYLDFKGRVEKKHSHLLAFDPAEQDSFLYDAKDEKKGLEFPCDIINRDLNDFLKGRQLN